MLTVIGRKAVKIMALLIVVVDVSWKVDARVRHTDISEESEYRNGSGATAAIEMPAALCSIPD